MTDKKTEALKLALEALENLPEMCGIEEAITAVQEALAEQPAQQEPVAYASDVEFDDETEIIPAEQKGKLGTAGLRIPLYIDPPASKPWVGLTEEEMRDLEKQFNAERVRTSDEEYLVIYPGDYWAWQRAIEAKLREKNA